MITNIKLPNNNTIAIEGDSLSVSGDWVRNFWYFFDELSKEVSVENNEFRGYLNYRTSTDNHIFICFNIEITLPSKYIFLPIDLVFQQEIERLDENKRDNITVITGIKSIDHIGNREALNLIQKHNLENKAIEHLRFTKIFNAPEGAIPKEECEEVAKVVAKKINSWDVDEIILELLPDIAKCLTTTESFENLLTDEAREILSVLDSIF